MSSNDPQLSLSAATMLTSEQAYAAMFHFLRDYYYRGRSDEIGPLLGSMSLLADGLPADSAYSDDWAQAVRLTLDKGTSDC